MIDLKYHIASLVAVFLALAAGILIGSSMVGSQSVENQIRNLKTRFDRIQADDRQVRNENRDLRQQVQTLESALRLAAPAAVRARLTGKRIAILASGAQPDAGLLRDIKQLLSMAGATVTSITVVKANLLPENPASRQAIVTRAGIDAVDPARGSRQLAGRVVRAIVQGAEPDFLRWVSQYSPGLTLDGEYSVAVDGVVWLASAAAEEEADQLASGTSVTARVAAVLSEQGTRAVACEPATVANSLMPHLARYNLTTVDCVDTPVGKIALVYALAGKEGQFGVKPSSARLLPELDVEPVTLLGPAPTR